MSVEYKDIINKKIKPWQAWVAASLLMIASVRAQTVEVLGQSSLPTTPLTLVDCRPKKVHLPIVSSNSSNTSGSEQISGDSLINPNKVNTDTVPIIDSTMVMSINTGLPEYYDLHDPSGMTFFMDESGNERIAVVDGEVEEGKIPTINFLILDMAGRVTITNTTTRFSNEPVGIAYKNDEFYIADDNVGSIWGGVTVGATGLLTTTQRIRLNDNLVRIDPEGVSFDPNGNLVIAGGSEDWIALHEPGQDGKFDGLCRGDDITYRINTLNLGIYDPEGAFYFTEPDGRESLYVSSTHDDDKIPVIDIDRINRQAMLREFINISQANGRKPADVAVTTSGDVGVVFRGRDNTFPPNNNDGQMNIVRPIRQQEQSLPKQVAFAPKNAFARGGRLFQRGKR